MISTGFVSAGAKVYISSRDEKACKVACEELNKMGPSKADYIQADFYKKEDCEKLWEEFERREYVRSFPGWFWMFAVRRVRC